MWAFLFCPEIKLEMYSGFANVGPSSCASWHENFLYPRLPKIHLWRTPCEKVQFSCTVSSIVQEWHRRSLVFFPLRLPFDSDRKKTSSGFFILLRVCRETKQHEFFRVWKKKKKNPAKDLCLTPTHNCVPTYNNSNNKTPICFHIQSDSSLSLFLIQSSYCRSDIGWLPLLPLSVCLSTITGVNTDYYLRKKGKHTLTLHSARNSCVQ